MPRTRLLIKPATSSMLSLTGEKESDSPEKNGLRAISWGNFPAYKHFALPSWIYLSWDCKYEEEAFKVCYLQRLRCGCGITYSSPWNKRCLLPSGGLGDLSTTQVNASVLPGGSSGWRWWEPAGHWGLLLGLGSLSPPGPAEGCDQPPPRGSRKMKTELPSMVNYQNRVDKDPNDQCFLDVLSTSGRCLSQTLDLHSTISLLGPYQHWILTQKLWVPFPHTFCLPRGPKGPCMFSRRRFYIMRP